jgi:zinc transporter ZupT
MNLAYAVLAALATFFTLCSLMPEFSNSENAKQATGEATTAALAVGVIVFLALAVGA